MNFPSDSANRLPLAKLWYENHQEELERAIDKLVQATPGDLPSVLTRLQGVLASAIPGVRFNDQQSERIKSAISRALQDASDKSQLDDIETQACTLLDRCLAFLEVTAGLPNVSVAITRLHDARRDQNRRAGR